MKSNIQPNMWIKNKFWLVQHGAATRWWTSTAAALCVSPTWPVRSSTSPRTLLLSASKSRYSASFCNRNVSQSCCKKVESFWSLFFCQWLKWKAAKVFVHIHVFRFLRGYRVVDLWPTRAAAQTGCDIMSVPLWSQLNFCVCFVVSAEMRLSAVVQTREQGHQDQSLSLLHAPTVQGNTTPLKVSIAKYAAAVRKWFISATRFNTWDLWEIPAPTRLTLLTPNVQIRWVLHQHFIKLSSFISFISKMKS